MSASDLPKCCHCAAPAVPLRYGTRPEETQFLCCECGMWQKSIRVGHHLETGPTGETYDYGSGAYNAILEKTRDEWRAEKEEQQRLNAQFEEQTQVFLRGEVPPHRAYDYVPGYYDYEQEDG